MTNMIDFKSGECWQTVVISGKGLNLQAPRRNKPVQSGAAAGCSPPLILRSTGVAICLLLFVR
jgi:hypothetical protein